MQYSYRDDLAYIHDAGFGHLAKSAALMLIDELQRIGFCVQTLACYGSLALPQGLIGFLARKPGNLDAQQIIPEPRRVAERRTA